MQSWTTDCRLPTTEKPMQGLTMESFIQDIRHAIRAIRRKPGWAVVAVLTLAFGIGANTAVFTLINGVLFKPPHVSNPGELVWVSSVNAGRPSQTMSYPDYLEYKQRVSAFAGTVAWSGNSLSLGGSTPQRVEGLVVTSNYFDVLGLKPALGRGFVSSEDTELGAHPVAVLGHNLWKRRFGSDPGILDSSIIVNGRAFRVVGVAPAGFSSVELGLPTDLFVPMGMLAAAMPGNGSLLTSPNAGWLRVVARLRGDLSKAQAEADIVASTLHTDRPPDDRYGVALFAMTGQLDPANRGQAAPILGLISLVPLLVLAVACANVASLLLAQGLARRRELAMRRALGATRGRLVRQMLTESLLLSLVAGVAGVVLASWLLELIVRLGSVPLEISLVLVPDSRVLALTTALAVVTGLVFGLLPALASTSPALTPAIKDDSGGVTPGRARHRLRNSFVVAQVTVSLVLLITAGLFLKSLGKALNVDPGFDGSRVAAVQFDLQLQGYTRDRARAFRERLTERALGIPGAQSAAIASLIPMGGRNYGTTVESSDPGVDRQNRVGVNINDVSPAYFETMGISMLRGRDFTTRDDAGAPPVVIVNETLARQMWPGADPIGKRLRLSERDESAREVIGVVQDGKYRNLVDAPRAFLFLPMRQRAGEGEVTLVVRVAGDPAPTVQALVRVLAELDRDLTIRRAATMREILARGAEVQRAAGAMLGVFGALALALAALGIYGVTAHSVTQRTREIGIRMSLGARAADVVSLFVRGAMGLAAIGVGIGVLVSAGVSGLLASFLFGLTATDSLTFISAAVVLGSVVALASYLPARRAVKVDPMVALRSE